MPVIQKISSLFNAKSLKRAGLGFVLAAGLPLAAQADDATARVFPPQQAEILARWNSNFEDLCLLPGDLAKQTPAAGRIRDILGELESSGTVGLGLAQTLQNLDTPVCLDPRSGRIDGFYADTWNVVFLKEDQPMDKTLLVLFHEARHAVQKTQGIIGAITTGRADAVQLAYAVEADAVAVAALAAWQMKEAGDDSVWETMKGEQLYGDIPRVFENHMTAGGTTTSATLAAFEQWYASPIRLQAYLHQTMQSYAAARAERPDAPYHEKLPDGFFNRLGDMPDGQNYGAKSSPLLKRSAFGG